MSDEPIRWYRPPKNRPKPVYKVRNEAAPKGEIAVRVVETGQEFSSLSDCAKYFRVTPTTIRRILDADGRFGDVTIERM